jgi:hypothetical protein
MLSSVTALVGAMGLGSVTGFMTGLINKQTGRRIERQLCEGSGCDHTRAGGAVQSVALVEWI